MHRVKRTIRYPSRNDRPVIWPLFDTHLGCQSVNEPLLRQHIDIIANDPLSYWISGGDMINGVTRRDKRYSHDSLADWCNYGDIIRKQLKYARELLAPIAHKCLGAVCGNHEFELLSKQERDAYGEYCDNLIADGAPEDAALGVQGFIRLQLQRGQRCDACSYGSTWSLVIYVHHGHGGASEGAAINTLKKKMQSVDANLILMGHIHKFIYPPPQLLETHDGTYARHAAFVPSYQTGMLHKGRDTYGERKGYIPNAAGTVPFVLAPKTKSLFPDLSYLSSGYSLTDS